MGLINLLFRDPLSFLLLAIPLLYSVIIHEVAHGWVAERMGDPTARYLGRLTLNPVRHIDPMGTIMLFIFGFGWAKPVPVNYSNFRALRKGLILVSSAGIAANICLAFLALLALKLWAPFGVAGTVLMILAKINIMLAAFNLIPIPPLDGSKILMGFAPREVQGWLEKIEPYGFFIVLGLLWLGALDPLISFFQWIILEIIGLVIS